MIPVKQTISNFVNGNCMQACVASIMEVPLETIPNFMCDGEEFYERNLNAWLKYQNFITIDVVIDKYNTGMLKDCYVIATGESPRSPDLNHAVVYYNGKMVHDPHPDNTGIIGDPKMYTVFVSRNPAEGGLLFSYRYELGRHIDAWLIQNSLSYTAYNVISWLAEKNFLNDKEVKKYLEKLYVDKETGEGSGDSN